MPRPRHPCGRDPAEEARVRCGRGEARIDSELRDDPTLQSDIAATLHNIGFRRTAMGDCDSAEVVIREAIAMRNTLYGGPHARTAATIRMLGNLKQQQGRLGVIRGKREQWGASSAAKDSAIAACMGSYDENHLDVAVAQLQGSDAGRTRALRRGPRDAGRRPRAVREGPPADPSPDRGRPSPHGTCPAAGGARE